MNTQGTVSSIFHRTLSEVRIYTYDVKMIYVGFYEAQIISNDSLYNLNLKFICQQRLIRFFEVFRKVLFFEGILERGRYP